jgi:hypothetical protein
MKPVRLLLLSLFGLTAATLPAAACERDKTAASCEAGYVWDDASHACIAAISS